MNRGQAESILDAYVENARSKSVNGMKAAKSLRKVILDAMTETRYCPLVACPDRPTMPINWDGTPKVTCTGIDPAFGTNTAVVE